MKLNDEEIKNIKFCDHEITGIQWIDKNKLLKMFEDPNVKITEGSKQTVLLFIKENLI